jgi:hypothetical protein
VVFNAVHAKTSLPELHGDFLDIVKATPASHSLSPPLYL